MTQTEAMTTIRQLLKDNGFIPTLTIHQPYASLLACGAKLYETRGWATKFRGWMLIHAGMNRDYWYGNCNKDYLNAVYDALKPVFYPHTMCNQQDLSDAAPYGEIIAIAELVGCRLIRQNPIDGVVHILDDTDAAVCITGYGAVSENEHLFGDWRPDRYAWETRNMTILDTPIAARGKQRIWKWRGEDFV